MCIRDRARREIDGDVKEAEFEEWEFPARSPIAFRFIKTKINCKDAIAHVWTLGLTIFNYQITISFERWRWKPHA